MITNNFMSVFSGVTSPHVFCYRCVLPVGFNFNLTYGLKPQVSRIKIITFYGQSISKLSGS